MSRGHSIPSYIYTYKYVLCTTGGYQLGSRFPWEHKLPFPRKILTLHIHNQKSFWDLVDLHHFTTTLDNV